MKNKQFIILITLTSIALMACSSHTHTFATEWSSDDTFHWHAATCGHGYVSDRGRHEYGEWSTVTEPTIDSEGLEHRLCNVCNHEETNVLEKLHVHTFEEGWTSDSTHHWHNATCEHTEEKGGYAEHTYGEYTVVTPATETEDGLETRTCTTCGYVDEHVIAALGHVHTFEDTYSYNSTHHWKEATCEHDEEVEGYEEHNMTEWTATVEVTDTTDGYEERHCTVCEYSETQRVYAPNHSHTYSENYSYDRYKHWRKATCGHDEITDEADHDFDCVTTTEDGKTIKKYTCKVCNYKYTTTSGDVTTPWTRVH